MRITLPESSRRGKRPARWTLVSVIAHSFALGALFVNQGFTTAPEKPRKEEVPIFVKPPMVEQEVRPVGPTVSVPGLPVTRASVPVLTVPDVNVPTMPNPVGQPNFNPAAYDQRGYVPFGGTPGATATPELGRVYDDRTVDRRVEPRPGNPIPQYPAVLSRSGIEGSVTVRFVVDTLGHVDRGSVQVLYATHALFEKSVREALLRMRYLPAQLGDKKVAQLVELPFHFAIRK